MSIIHRALIYKETPQGALVVTPYLPDDWAATDTRAGIVFFCGGGWVHGQTAQFARQASALADQGMVAYCADYRVMSRHAVLAPTCVEDGKSAIRWLRQQADQLGLDGRRLVAAGGSAGGHVAACAGLIPGFDDPAEDLTVSSTPTALALFNPVLDVTFDVRLSDRFGGATIAERLSPLRHIRADLPPTWITHGDEDTSVPFRQARQYTAQMLAAGNQVTFLEAPGMQHGFFNSSPWLEMTLDSLSIFLAGLGYLA
jgi:acetyl esterase/lipase